MDCKLLRRKFLVGGSLSLVATAINVDPASAKPNTLQGMTTEERANVELLKEFLGGWNKSDLDIDKLTAKYIAPNASIRWFDDEDVLIGPEAAAKNAKKSAGNDVRVETKFLEIFAKGPLVATSRVDTVKLPGKPVQTIKVAGVAIIKEGKIHEYCDYIIETA